MGTYRVVMKATFDTCETCRAYCCKPIPKKRKKPVAIDSVKSFALEKIFEKLFASKYIATGNTAIVAKKNLEKLNVKGPIVPIPVV